MNIESGVPMPERRRGRGRGPVYPFAAMKVGDSFVAGGDAGAGDRARWAAMKYARRHDGYRFVSEKQANGSVRVWRVGT